MTTPDNITIAQAAALLGVADITVMRYCRDGRLKAWKARRQWTIPRAGVMALKRQWEEGIGQDGGE